MMSQIRTTRARENSAQPHVLRILTSHVFTLNHSKIPNLDPHAGLFVNHRRSLFECDFVSLDSRLELRKSIMDNSFTLGSTREADNVKILQSCKVEYGVSNPTEYGVSSSLSNTTYSSQQINTAYPLPLDTAYRSFGTETKIIDFRAKNFLPSFGTNPTDCLSLKHFKSLSLDELRSPDFNLLSDKEYSEEEEEEAMAETMEQYMSKTRTDYRSGVARPKIDNKDQFKLKGQFLKELRENTFSGSDNKDANEHIKKVLEIVDLFHVPNITVDQLMLRVFLISLTGAASHWLRNKPTGSIKTWEDLKTKFLTKYCPPSRTAKKMEEINNFQQKWKRIFKKRNKKKAKNKQIQAQGGKGKVKSQAK
ncbi:hypothetical protein Tco_0206368 [Tanacetum coccineum]